MIQQQKRKVAYAITITKDGFFQMVLLFWLIPFITILGKDVFNTNATLIKSLSTHSFAIITGI